MNIFNKLTISSVLLTLLISIPGLILIANVFAPSENWQHLVDTVLFDYIFNSLYIMLGVAFLTSILGFTTAYITTFFQFTGSKFFHYGLILPFAIPTYIMSYIYGGMFDITGTVTTFILNLLGKTLNEVYFFDIMSIEGAILVMSLVLYPYVYLISKTYLKSESSSIIDASKTMGLTNFQIFYKVIIPISRPAIVAGVILAVMEAVADYGVMDYYGVSTFVTGIFRTWLGMGSVEDASKLASMLMIFIFVLIFCERFQRRNKRYKSSGKDFKPIIKEKLTGTKAFLAFIACFIPFFFGFLLPFSQMSFWFYISYEEIIDEDFLRILLQTLSLGVFSSILITLLAFVITYNVRLHKNKIAENLLQISKLGYSIPGAVVAVGVLSFFSIIDKSFDILISGSVIAIVFGYVVRFIAVSINNYESGFSKIPQTYDDACKTMQIGSFQTFFKVILPLVKGSMMASFIIVFIETMKELPLTMILRPFNFDTLPVLSHELVTQAQIIESSVPAMFIVLLGIVSVLVLAKKMVKD
ncbi:iron ABC transporter permease [Halarcobacter sp.]|uniref:ABC transporter permease n=1 Tax=Halarcobacter sp. TaxID=2321133 RepID=UPI002AA71834|nr:iron ABC transporter permease [Halarcobacter sp.]